MKIKISSLALLSLLGYTSISLAKPVYTSLAEKACKTTSVDAEAAASTQLCQGVDGYKLKLTDSDNRQDLTMIDPKGKEYALDMYHKVGNGFSSFAPRVEWVKKGSTPTALVVSMKIADDTRKSKERSSVVVTKISPQVTCVVGVVETKSFQDKRVRQMANQASSMKCL